MPVVPVLRFILRGKIRAQVTYAINLGFRIVKAGRTNPSLDLFAVPGSTTAQAEFLALLAYWQTLLQQKTG
jgi:hypothetical protein